MSLLPPSPFEQEIMRKKQEAFMKKCEVEDLVDPPKNLPHKIGRTIWRILTYPRINHT